jgi:predicted ATPase
MLKSITLKNFKSYADATLPLAELTVLLGPNASGKSNALEAIQLLMWLAEGRRLDYLLQTMAAPDLVNREIDLRGSPTELAQKAGPVGLGCKLDDGAGRHLILEMGLGISEDGLRIVSESLWSSTEGVPLYSIDKPAEAFTNQVLVAYNNFLRGGKKPVIAAIDQQAIFSQLTTPARFEERHKRSQEEIPTAASAVQKALESILFLDPVPRRMRSFRPKIDHKKLHGDGSNLSAVLRYLCNGAGRREDVLGFVRSLPEQDIVGIDFLEAPQGEVMVQLHESFGGHRRPVSARLLSDGTLRVLAIAAALLSVPEGALVVIEEIDNGVHPARARALLESIRAVAASRKIRVLLTTHNPALLDAIPVDALPDAVACYRDPSDGLSRLQRLGDVEAYPELVAQGPLGQIITRGILERVLKNPPTAESRGKNLQLFFETLEKRS